MKLIHLLLLFALFHHHNPNQPSKKEVIRFVHTATDTLKSYEDGSTEQWIESGQIAIIHNNIQLLISNPKRKDAVDIEGAIIKELRDLKAYDYKLQSNSYHYNEGLNSI